MVNKEKIKQSFGNILQAINEDPTRDGLQDTPKRIADLYQELFAGVGKDPKELLDGSFELGHRELIILKNIQFFSMCEHHFLPFFGMVHIGYIPGKDGRVVGISKLAEVVNLIAHRPQIQERMATEIADALYEGLKPDSVGVVIEAEHMCMSMRGIKKLGAKVITSALRGRFRTDIASRQEFMSLIEKH
ncbi:MAG: GTP cyclohydrolase I FolE [Chloroflexi bacterium]|nr:GTP cyclohydrolase I FolE [Chloroflexota bacterium]